VMTAIIAVIYALIRLSEENGDKKQDQ
jgi:hypothetical protein